MDEYTAPKGEISKVGGRWLLKCGSSEIVCDPDRLPEYATFLMQEIDRLRWIIRQVDEKIGGTVCLGASEPTQNAYEKILCQPTE